MNRTELIEWFGEQFDMKDWGRGRLPDQWMWAHKPCSPEVTAVDLRNTFHAVKRSDIIASPRTLVSTPERAEINKVLSMLPESEQHEFKEYDRDLTNLLSIKLGDRINRDNAVLILALHSAIEKITSRMLEK